MVGAMILAAGASTRMGQAKASLPFRGGTFLSTVVEAAHAARLDPIIVVLGPDGRKILENHDLGECTVAWNPDTAAGPMASIQAGFGMLNRPVDALVVWHVDRPHVRSDTVATVVEAFRLSHCPIVVPTYEGRRGHPVLFAQAVFAELTCVPKGQGARVVVRKDPARVLEVPTADAAVLEDVDSPDDYMDLLDRA